MSSRRQTRLAHRDKISDRTNQSVQDVVSEVIRNIAANEEQDADNLRSYLNSYGDVIAAAQPTDAMNTEADGLRSCERNGGGGQSLTPPPREQAVASNAQQSRMLRRQSFQVVSDDDHVDQGDASGGAQPEETEMDLIGNPFVDDNLITEAAHVRDLETNDISKKSNGAGRQSPEPPPGQLLANDLQQSDEEPDQRAASKHQHVKSSNWSDDIHFDDLEEVEIRDSKGKRGKKGGPILPRHVWSLRPGVRFVVAFNSLDQPVRKGGYVLIRFLGDVAKVGELCPIGEVSWKKVDKSCKVNIIALVREKFVLPDQMEINKNILAHVGKKWRGYRHNLKMDYKKPGKTQEQVASNVPKGVIPSQWMNLVEYWFSEKCEIYSQAGKVARSAQLHRHTTGAKSYARQRDEFEKVHGREPGDLEWFLKTHQRADGSFVESTTKEFVDTAAALISQRGSSSSKKRVAVEKEVFNELMYSDDEILSRRPIGYGFGVNRYKVFGVEEELRRVKNRYLKKMRFGLSSEGSSSYLSQETSAQLEKLNSAVIGIGETNELMQGQIKMQSQQLQMQSQQLQMHSKQIQGLQSQLQQVTSLLTKFGSKLNSPRVNSMPKQAHFQGVNSAYRRVLDAPSESGDGESDSTDWFSD